APGRLRVDVEPLDAGRPLVGIEVDPDAVDLDSPARVAGDRPAASRGDRGEAAAPGDEFDLAVEEKRLAHLEPDPPDEPEVLGRAPPRLRHVLDRDVLEEPGDRVEAQAAALVHVREPDPPARRKRPPTRGPWQ